MESILVLKHLLQVPSHRGKLQSLLQTLSSRVRVGTIDISLCMNRNSIRNDPQNHFQGPKNQMETSSSKDAFRNLSSNH